MTDVQPQKPIKRILARFNRFLTPAENASELRIRRRNKTLGALTRRIGTIRLVLFVCGYLWMLALPSDRLARRVWIDENALQPNRVDVHWNWGEVHTADRYLDDLENLRDQNATSDQRAQYLLSQFQKLGLPSSTQKYHFSASSGDIQGSNAFAILSSPRVSGTEAMVISASWLSRTGDGEGQLNLRGVATVLSLAGYLNRYAHWSKDLIFIINDGYLDGMQAWLSAYYGVSQPNLHAEPLEIVSGVIWAALCVDYPGHSYSHLGIFHEGLNGRLPNQDLVTSLYYVASSNSPVIMYDHLDSRDVPDRRDELDPIPLWVPRVMRDMPDVRAYAYRAMNLLRHIGYQARGRASGVHGLFHQYRVDAITLFAYPATGPYGFHAIGRSVEGTLRAANNMLERLHASFFFYLLPVHHEFIQIGKYLPSAILISVAMIFGGLKIWSDAGWTRSSIIEQKVTSEPTWTRRRRPVIPSLLIVLATHLMGTLLFFVVKSSWFVPRYMSTAPILFITFTSLPPLITIFLPPPTVDEATTAPLSSLLKAFNLCIASTIISIISVLNFSMAASLAVFLGIPLSISSSSPNPLPRVFKYFSYALLGLGWLLFGSNEPKSAIRDWEMFGGWFAPFVCIVYAPLVFQAAIVCLQPQ
ncbi:Gaa1-domain-containing protein [Pluteus cervinus]|uniref:Gaa1-domain-containing protein n=1 Tax=Pluteus cervinus TaxID=181527 RepID=A0ACD3BEF5_9AGAR|nr:Gaa1-domain-containing protein [Pluteus cervinus]